MQIYAGSRMNKSFWRCTFALGLLTFTAVIAAGFILEGNSLAALEDRGTNPAASVAKNHRESIEITIDTETQNNAELKSSLDLAEKYKKALTAEAVYSVQLSAYGNILLLPQTTVADLEKAKIDTLKARDAIAVNLKEISDKTDPFNQMLNQTREQLSSE